MAKDPATLCKTLATPSLTHPHDAYARVKKKGRCEVAAFFFCDGFFPSSRIQLCFHVLIIFESVTI